ncbi:MAG: hypothetical protein MJ139_03300, partial [Limosilactobacillus sp.]|nr:hypothetical protein [Limosilactobacillus sp.]
KPLTTWSKFWLGTKKAFRKIWLVAALMVVLLSIESWLINHQSLSMVIKQIVTGIFWGSNTFINAQMVVGNVGVMWFLFVMFWAKLIFNVSELVIKEIRYLGPCLAILAYFGYQISLHVWLPQALDVAVIAAFLMWIGRILKVLNYSDSHYEFGVVILALIFWLACIQNNTYLELSNRTYPNFILNLVEAVAGTVVMIYVSKGLLKTQLAKPLLLIGQHTLAILIIHHLDLYWLIWQGMIHSNNLAALVRLGVDLIILMIYLIGLRIFRQSKLNA